MADENFYSLFSKDKDPAGKRDLSHFTLANFIQFSLNS